MADHFVSLNRGKDGFKANDFTTGTSSTAGDAIELRVADGASLTRKDIQIALDALERFFQDDKMTTAAGIVYTV